MAYSAIAASELLVNKPLTASLMSRLDENPKALFAQMGFDVNVGYFESAELAVTAGATATVAHSLANEPIMVQGHLVCVTTDGAWAVDDRIYDIGFGFHVNNSPCGIIIGSNATDVKYSIGSDSTAVNALNASTGAGINLTLANWKLVIRAWG